VPLREATPHASDLVAGEAAAGATGSEAVLAAGR
jgi:hypothetical protein